ncbi:unnamed protein product, partial [Heterosigma akashiwo]
MVGTMAWVANWTRPELAFTLTNCSAPSIILNPITSRLLSARSGVTRAFTDADFCSDRTDGKSVSGYVLLLLGDAPIVWASRLQGAVTTSTVEAEYLALRSAVKDIMWLRHLLADLGCPQHEPTPL